MTSDAAMSLAEALVLEREGMAIEGEGVTLTGRVVPGFDVFGIPHGGYLLAMAGQAALTASSEPDIFSITLHLLKKAQHGPITWSLREVARSRRMVSLAIEGRQDETVIAGLALVGDRTGIAGERYERRAPPEVEGRAQEAGPAISQKLGLVIAEDSLGFATGELRGEGVMHARVDPPGHVTDQLLALVACDIAPPAIWNALGTSGWVPTVEITAHVRARPAQGPLRVRALTRSVSGGFLEEDAEVYDTEGTLVALSRQLARWRS
ncbi:MAG: thioesterase family protein [Polyangiaceae bacterium]